MVSPKSCSISRRTAPPSAGMAGTGLLLECHAGGSCNLVQDLLRAEVAP